MPANRILALGVGALFLIGLPLGVTDAHDLAPVYAGASCLIHGCNPYDMPSLDQELLRRGTAPSDLPLWYKQPYEPDGFPKKYTSGEATSWEGLPGYPPSTMLVLTPLALLPYTAAKAAWAIASMSLLAIAAWLMIGLASPDHKSLTAILAAIVLALSGRTLIGTGQPAALTIGLAAVSTMLFLKKSHPILASLLLALSLAIKPQIAILLVLMLLLRPGQRRYGVLTVLLMLASTQASVAILKSRPATQNALADWQNNAMNSTKPGGPNNADPSNRNSVSEVQIQALASIFIENRATYETLALVLAVVLLIPFFRSAAVANPSQHLIAIAGATAVSLLPVYHRAYDTRILLLAIPGALVILATDRKIGLAITALIPISIISFQTYLEKAMRPHYNITKLLHSNLVMALLLREQNICLIALTTLLSIAAVRSWLHARQSAAVSAAPSLV